MLHPSSLFCHVGSARNLVSADVCQRNLAAELVNRLWEQRTSSHKYDLGVIDRSLQLLNGGKVRSAAIVFSLSHLGKFALLIGQVKIFRCKRP